MTDSSGWRTAAAVFCVILSLPFCVEGIYRRNITECEAFLSDANNDPHDWLDSVSATGQIIDVTCETGFEPIRGVTPKEFCALAPPGMSYCIHPTMIYAVRMTSDTTAYCIIPMEVDRTDDYLGTYSTYYAKPYADCDVDHETQGYHFVYGETAEKHSLQSFNRSATCDEDDPTNFQYIDKLDGNQAYLKTESRLSDTDSTWWLYKVGNNLEYVMADGDKQTDQIWAIRDNNIIETDAQITAGNPATLEEQERLNIFFNFVINAPCREDQDCERYEQNLTCDKNQPIRNLPSGVGICICPGDMIWEFQNGCQDRDDTACYDYCENGGTCYLDVDMCPICECDTFFTGATCSNKDECSADEDNCDDNAVCTDEDPDWNCVCVDGYEGSGVSCSDINECPDTPCDAAATCSNTDGSYTCACDSGYTGDGQTCSDIDECDSGCDADATCTNTEGSYTCDCNSGYTGDGQTCTDIDECDEDSDGCDGDALCENTDGSYTCTCYEGSGYTGDGTDCTYDECLDSPCGSNGGCEMGSGGYTCSCDVGFNGQNCDQEDDCADVTCNGNGLCDPGAGSDTDDDNDEYLCLCDCNVSGTDCNNENPVRIHSLSTTFNSDCTEASLSYNRTSTFLYPASAPELQDADIRPTYTLYLTTRLNYELNKNGGEWQEIDYTEDTDGNEPISIGTVEIKNLVPFRDYVSFIAYDIPGRLDNCTGPTIADPTIGTFRYDFTTCRPRFGEINTRAALQLTTRSCKDTRTRNREFRIGCECWKCMVDVFAVPIDCPTVLPECQTPST